MAATDPERRREIAASGGRARAARTDHEALAAAGRKGATALHDPATLARRLVAHWPDLDRGKRAEIRAILKSLQPRERAR